MFEEKSLGHRTLTGLWVTPTVKAEPGQRVFDEPCFLLHSECGHLNSALFLFCPCCPRQAAQVPAPLLLI